jgi:hypothetical protein
MIRKTDAKKVVTATFYQLLLNKFNEKKGSLDFFVINAGTVTLNTAVRDFLLHNLVTVQLHRGT